MRYIASLSPPPSDKVNSRKNFPPTPLILHPANPITTLQLSQSSKNQDKRSRLLFPPPPREIGLSGRIYIYAERETRSLARVIIRVSLVRLKFKWNATERMTMKLRRARVSSRLYYTYRLFFAQFSGELFRALQQCRPNSCKRALKLRLERSISGLALSCAARVDIVCCRAKWQCVQKGKRFSGVRYSSCINWLFDILLAYWDYKILRLYLYTFMFYIFSKYILIVVFYHSR